MNKLTTLTGVMTLAAGVVFSTQAFAGEGLGLDDYQCYLSSIPQGDEIFEQREVLFINPFNDPEQTTKTLRNVKFICAPVNQHGEAINNPESYLVCYSIKPATKTDKYVLATNEFGERLLRAKKSRLLCVQSTIRVVEKPKK